MNTTTFPEQFPLGLEGRPMARPTAEQRPSWKQTGVLSFTIIASVFAAGKLYGSDTTAMRADLVAHAAKLEESNRNTVKLTNAMEALTAVTQQSSSEQSAQRQWFIRTLQALTDSLTEGEKRRRLREIAAEMQRVSRNTPPEGVAGGSVYAPSR